MCERRVDLLVCSLPLHRHSYIGFILAFASSFHNKQQPLFCSSILTVSSRCQQSVVATVEESVLRTEMAGLESQEEDTPKRVLFYKPMSWLGQIRPHRRDESWSPSL